jgi:type IV pilus assembly protein PilB
MVRWSRSNDDVNLQEQQATMDAPVVTLVNAILADAAKRRCSDIHIEPYEKYFGSIPN